MSRLYGEPFAKIPERLLDADVSDRAIRLWCILDRHADNDGRAWPGRPRLAKRLRCGVSSLDRALAELVGTGLVVVEPNYRDDGSRTSNSYWLWPATPPVGGPLPTGEQAPLPPAGVPLPAQRAAVGNESQSNDSQGIQNRARSFEDFWRAYPRREGKRAAEKAWSAAVKLADPEVIVAGAKRYRDDPNRVPTYTAHPSTWLNRGGWEDDPLPPRGAQRGPAPAGAPRLSRSNDDLIRAQDTDPNFDPEAF